MPSILTVRSRSSEPRSPFAISCAGPMPAAASRKPPKAAKRIARVMAFLLEALHPRINAGRAAMGLASPRPRLRSSLSVLSDDDDPVVGRVAQAFGLDRINDDSA